MSIPDKFPDLYRPDDIDCVCGHSSKHHFTLGCTKCSCVFFEEFEAVEHSVQRMEPTCAICGEPERVHHPEDGGHEFHR